MKKLYLMICICGLIVAMTGMIGIRPAIGQDCVPVEVDVKPGRRNTIRLGSRSWVPIIIYSDPNEGGFQAANVDPNTVTFTTETLTNVYVQPLGSLLIDADRSGTRDLVLFYIGLATQLELVEGENEITVRGDFIVNPGEEVEVVDCFEGTDTVTCVPRFIFWQRRPSSQ